MSDWVIRAEGLGKAYQIRHEAEARHTRFSEMLSERAARLLRHAPRVADPTRETFWALRDVSFEIREGEVVGVIGRNGAGKSTLLKILSRITEPTEGRVELRGRVASLLEVGTGFHPELTGRENIFLNGAILGMSRAEIRRKFDEIVDFAGVERFLDTPVKRFSSGMYVRLAFAVAAHLEPEILVVDEVLAVGDIEFQRKCLGKMGEVARGGRTVLFVSHNMNSLNQLCERGLVLEGGRVQLDAPIEGALKEYNAGVSRRRLGNDFEGGAHVKGFSIDSDDRLSNLVFPVGAPLKFSVAMARLPNVATFTIAIGVDDAIGNRTMTLLNEFDRRVDGAPWNPERDAFVCEIGEFPVSPGVYTAKVVIFDARTNAVLEAIEGAAQFEVSSIVRPGFPTYRASGFLRLRQDWSVQRAPASAPNVQAAARRSA